jgi:trehalose/maltose hydrolase-like predicted phosphorylase
VLNHSPERGALAPIVEQMDNESMVNLPNWLPLRIRVGDGDWLDLARCDVTAYWQELDLRHGIFSRQTHVRDPARRRTLVSERRIVSMAQPHLAAQELSSPSSLYVLLLTSRR